MSEAELKRAIATEIQSAIETDPYISFRSLNERFEHRGVTKEWMHDRVRIVLAAKHGLGKLGNEAHAPSLEKERSVTEKALLSAAWSGNSHIAHAILSESCEEINCTDDNGCSALIIASAQGHAKLVDFFLEKNASADLQNKDGQTALHVAAKFQKAGVVAKLLNRGGLDLGVKDRNGQTATALAGDCGTRTHALLRGEEERLAFLSAQEAERNRLEEIDAWRKARTSRRW